MSLLLYSAAFLATAGSMFWLTRIAISQHADRELKSLSERAAAETRLLRYFKGTLFTCATLFTVSIYGFIGPRLHDGRAVVVAWTVVYISILLTALLPARGKTFWPHVIAAHTMGVGMLVLAFAFWRSLGGAYATTELLLSVLMTLLALLTFADKKRYIYHELGFIYLNHITIVTAAVALRSIS